jgi:hypothetical protein
MKHVWLLQGLRGGKTLSGLEILRPWRHRENYMRIPVNDLSSTVIDYLESQEIADDVLRKSITVLRISYTNNTARPRRAQQPAKSRKGVRAEHVSALNYWVVFNRLLSDEGGFSGFAQRVKLDDRITYEALFGLIALLLIDSAVAHLNHGHCFPAAAELLHAAEARDEMLYETLAKEWQRQGRTLTAQAAARARHHEKDEIRKALLAEWDTGRFEGNKAAAGRSALKDHNVHPRTVERWIREHEKKVSRC